MRKIVTRRVTTVASFMMAFTVTSTGTFVFATGATRRVASGNIARRGLG